MAVLNIDNSKYARKSWTLTEQGNNLLKAKRYTLAFIGHNIADDKIISFINKLEFKGAYEKYDNVADFIMTNRGNPLEKTYIIFQIIADLDNELSFNIASLDAIDLNVRFHFLSHTSEFLDNALALTQILHTINLCQQSLTGQIYNIDEFLHTHSQTDAPITMTEEYTDTEIDDFDPSSIKFIFITSRIPNDEESKIIHLKLLDIGFESELLYYQSPLDIDFSKHEHNKLAIINTVNDSKAVALDITEPQIADKLILYMHLNGLERLLHDCSDVYMWISEVIDDYVINSEDDPKNTNLANLQQVFIDTGLSNLYNSVSLPAKVTNGKGSSSQSQNNVNNAISDSANLDNSASTPDLNANSNLGANTTPNSASASGSSSTANTAHTNSHSNNNNPQQQATSRQAHSSTNTTSGSNRMNSNRNLSPVVAFVGINPNQVPPQVVNDMVSFILGHSNNNYQFFKDYNDLYASINSNPNLLFNIINGSPINYDFVKAVNFGFMLQLSNFEQVNYDNARVIASLRLLIDLVKSGSYQNIINLA